LKSHQEGHPINIIDSITIDIKMAVGGPYPKEEVEAIISHKKALQQCGIYLSKEFPDARLVEANSTAKGLELAIRGEYGKAAALASPIAFERRGVTPYEIGVADAKYNKTRFLVIKRGGKSGQSKKSKKDITTVAVVPVLPIHNFSGKMFELFEKYGLRYEDHHLRPTGRDMDIHYFDLEGHIKANNNLQKCLEALKSEMPFRGKVEVYNLGSYQYQDFFPSVIQRIAVIGAASGRGKTLQEFLERAGYETVLAKSHSDFEPARQQKARLREIEKELKTLTRPGVKNTGKRNASLRRVGELASEIADATSKLDERLTSPKTSQGDPEGEFKTVRLAEAESKDMLSGDYIAEMRRCASASNVILLNVYRKNREQAVRAIAEQIFAGKLLVVNSSRLDGEEERIRSWIHEEMVRAVDEAVCCRDDNFSAASSTEKYVRSAIKRKEASGEWNKSTSEKQMVDELVKEHCDGIEFLGMDALITDSFPVIEGQKVVFTPKVPYDMLDEMTLPKEFIDIFYKHGADVKIATPKYHDKITGTASVLPMLTSLIAAETILPLGYDFDELREFSIPENQLFYSLMQKNLAGSIESAVAKMFEFSDRQGFLERLRKEVGIIFEICKDNPEAYELMLKQMAKRTKKGRDEAIRIVRDCFEILSRK